MTETATAAPPRARRLADIPAVIADEIRGMIARGTLPPGGRLSQTELAEQFGASRVPIREALKQLTSEALIEHIPNRGFFVCRVSLDEARQLFLMRDLIEDALLRTIAWPDQAMLDLLQQRADTLEALLDAGDRTTWWPAHREFHAMVFNLSPRKVLVREALRLWAHTDRFRSLLSMPRRVRRARESTVKHELVEALASRDMEHLLQVRRARRGQFEAQVEETLESLGLL